MAGTGRAAELVRVLEVDPDLTQRLDPAVASVARREVIAEVAVLPKGHWSPPSVSSANGGSGLGLLVLEGFLLRTAVVGGKCGVELFGRGDLLNPTSAVDASASLLYEDGWTVLRTTRLARLDDTFELSVARWPGVLAEVTSRALARSHLLAFHRAVAQLPGLRLRLLVLLWYFADRWGHVNGDGVVLPLRLSHQVLSGLVAAARPSVSAALAGLVDDGAIARSGDGRLVLRGKPPIERVASSSDSDSWA